MKIRKMGVALILMAVIAITACAQNYDKESNFVVKVIDGGKGVEITDYVGNKFEVNIPPQIKNLPVTSIGKQAFANEKNIISITMPNSVTNIGLMAFTSCTSLNSITIPANVTNIGNAAFSGCTSLTAINIAGGNKTYASQDGVLYDKSKTTLIKYPQGKTASSFNIPNSVTNIGDFAFEACSNLTSVTLPTNASFTSTGNYVFYKCTSLTSITIPNNVTSIGDAAFFECTSLTSVTIPNSITSIGNGAFQDCSKLTSITIPNSVTSIKGQAFYSGLTSVTFQGTIVSDKLGNLRKDGYDLDYSPFRGDLRDKYLAGGIGTYIVVEQDVYGFAKTWTKQ